MNMSHRIIGKAVRGLAVAAFTGALALPALAAQPEDAWITTKVKMALLTDSTVDALDINVDTFDGRVTLHGRAGSTGEKTAAEKAAMEIEGVREVRNLVAVVPDSERETTQVADDELARNVSNVLERDAALASSDIEVESVNDGIVVLSGKAETLTAHRRALEDARSVEGVRQVASEIESPDELGDAEIWQETDSASTTAGEAGRMATDAWITTKAKVFLVADPGLSPLSVNVDTRRGVVTLFGIVGTEELKQRAGTEVAKIEGVTSVENELQVVADVAADRVEAQDDELLSTVEKRLEERESLADADIDVEVKNRVVRLTGTVPTQRDRLTALTIAGGTGGVDSVIDDLRLVRPKRS
jgi:hyperosmotically inducible protein